jgi:hypothetical protein
MRRGLRPTAAGSPHPGTAPLLTHPLSTYFPQPEILISVFLRALSNRHTMQLEFLASPAISTTSLFLIVPNHPLCPASLISSSVPLDCGGAPPLCSASSAAARVRGARRPRSSARTISNRHTMRLKLPATRSESTTSLFLIVPTCPHFHSQSVREFYRG